MALQRRSGRRPPINRVISNAGRSMAAGHVWFGVKSKKAPNEQMFSGLPPKADLGSALALVAPAVHK